MNNNNTPEIIRAATPLVLASIGCVIGGMVIFNPSLSEGRWASGMGLAGTAITGAAGLAQSNSKDNYSSNNETRNTHNPHNRGRVAVVKNINKKGA